MKGHWGTRAAVLLSAIAFTTACGAVYAQGGRYPNYPSPSRSYPRYQDPAFSRGFDDGYRQGLDASRDGDRYDVRREQQYRNAERGYDRRYGSRNEWRRVYRDGFAAGYDQGYRDGRYRNGPYRRY
jgi:hypothetical protein